MEKNIFICIHLLASLKNIYLSKHAFFQPLRIDILTEVSVRQIKWLQQH